MKHSKRVSRNKSVKNIDDVTGHNLDVLVEVISFSVAQVLQILLFCPAMSKSFRLSLFLETER